MVQAYKNYWINAFNFHDRTSRGDFWRVILMNFIVSFVLGLIIGIVFGNVNIEYDFTSVEAFSKSMEQLVNSPSNLITSIWSLVNLIPGLAIDIRRLHDTNRSGLWLLTFFIPLLQLIFFIVVLVFYCLPSVDAGNKYGSKQV